MVRKKTQKEWLEEWARFGESIANSSSIDPKESATARLKRIKKLEGDSEAWFRYYFELFYTDTPAKFHLESTRIVMQNPELYLVRSWARELSKSVRTMMEVLKLTLTGKKKNVLLVSNSYDNANRLLMPYKTILEKNSRIIQDYGRQKNTGSWEEGEFTTRAGVSFRAIGAGQSPRGTRRDASRPDVILIDDIDTDKEVKNPEIIKERIKWIEQALLGTRSISRELLVIACGNIIAKYSCITEMGSKADRWEVVNIRDENGRSTWPKKNTEEKINRVLSTISYESAQKEYFNNPMDGGEVFKELVDKAPFSLQECTQVVIYADPATSNSESKNASHKAIGILAAKGLDISVHKVWVDHMSNAKFIDYLFKAYRLVKLQNAEPVYVYIENNSLQNPFYEQVLLPMIYGKAAERGVALPVRPDERKKPDKYSRIEATLEPLIRNEYLTFNEEEKNNPHMQRLKAQFTAFSRTAKIMDGPDMVEGAVVIIKELQDTQALGEVEIIPRTFSKYRI